MVFYWFGVPSGNSFFIKKLEKQRLGTTRSDHQKTVPKKYDFWVAEISKSEPPCRREHDFKVLSKSRKVLDFGVVLVLPFEPFGLSYPRKNGFQGCLNFVRFLHRLLSHFKPPERPSNYVKWGSIFGIIFCETFLAWEREARLIMRVLPTYARSFHRPSQNLRIFQYA